MADATGIEERTLAALRPDIQPVCDAICRALADGRSYPPATRDRAPGITEAPASQVRFAEWRCPSPSPMPARTRRGPLPRPVTQHPEPLWSIESDPRGFTDALRLHMARHGDTAYSLYQALTEAGGAVSAYGLAKW